MGYALAVVVGLLVGYRFGVKAGFNYADNNWFQHLEKHGWNMVTDPEDPDSPGIPTQKYGDHWYQRRDEP